jgi:hypothetical protein
VERVQCVVAYHANGGGAPTRLADPTYGGTEQSLPYAISHKKFRPPRGMRFRHWNTQPDGRGATYPAGYTFNIYYDMDLYAIWEARPRQEPAVYNTVTYDSNGGANPPESAEVDAYISAQSMTSLAEGDGMQPPERTMVFEKWNTKADGSGTSYAGGQRIYITADMRLYAIWKELQTYTLSFDPNGGTGSIPSVTIREDDENASQTLPGADTLTAPTVCQTLLNGTRSRTAADGA